MDTTEQNKTELAPINPPAPSERTPIEMGSDGLMITSMNDLIRVSEAILVSGFAPKSFTKWQQVMVAIQMGSELGMKPMMALQSIAVINGMPTVWGDGALALVQASKPYDWHKEWTEGEGDNMIAYCTFKRKGNEPHTTKFSVAQAKKAELWGKAGPWQKYPERMLQLRARAFGFRDKFADILRGFKTAEEVMDYPPEAFRTPEEASRPDFDGEGLETENISTTENKNTSESEIQEAVFAETHNEEEKQSTSSLTSKQESLLDVFDTKPKK